MWVQSRLAIDVDADWGEGSKAAEHGFRAEHGLVQTRDDARLEISVIGAENPSRRSRNAGRCRGNQSEIKPSPTVNFPA